MPNVANFSIDYTQFLDEHAKIVQQLPDFALDSSILIELYRAMMLTRLFDKKAVALQRTGQMGTYPSSWGQEAISVAIGSAMRKDDVLFPYYREYGAQFLRGVKMEEILLYWGGDERGMDYAEQHADFPICVPIASHATHAVGVAYAMKLRRQDRVAVFVCGDGATSKGDFYEALNAAGVWKLPVVFIVNNNQWAISVPRSQQTGSETIAQKAIAAGFNGEQVDGNDVIAVRNSIENAMAKARQGKGPSLIEALTYRLCDHTTADDASRYRSKQEFEENEKKEPLIRLQKYMLDQGFWSAKQEEALLAECQTAIEKAVETYLNTPAQPPSAMFEFMFETMPHDLVEQRASLSDGEK